MNNNNLFHDINSALVADWSKVPKNIFLNLFSAFYKHFTVLMIIFDLATP